ncbi:MAG: hypothetical protein MI724_05095 [Spirochaetales bacterium]|nr:hypothetical protein [Spirochaetales bacterium]
MQSILTIDIGTSSMRGALFSLDGTLLFSAAFPYSPTFMNDGRVRQSPGDWVTGAYHVLSQCRRYAENHMLHICAISLASQRASVVPLNGAGVPLHDAVMWQDKTTDAQCDALLERIGVDEAYRVTGLRIDPYFCAPKIMWFRDSAPDIFAEATHFVGVQDYVAFALTGRLVTDASQASRTLLMDLTERRWSATMLEAAGIEAARFPEIVEPGTVVGTLTAEAAQRTGLPRETPLILAGGDQQVAAVGMGVIAPGTVEANTGTGSFLISPVERPTFHPAARTLCSVAAVPGQWVVEAGVLTTGLLYRWFAREFVPGAPADDESLRFEQLNRIIEDSPTGANGVIVLPHFKGSAAPFWDRHAKGVFFNLTPAHTRSDLARAVLESIVLEMGANLALLQSVVSRPLTTVVSAGGLTAFDLFNQIQADVFGLPIEFPDTVEATSVGAFVGAAVSLGVYESHQAALATVEERTRRRIVPRKSATGLYRRTAEVREALYHALHDAGVYDRAHRYSNRIGDV